MSLHIDFKNPGRSDAFVRKFGRQYVGGRELKTEIGRKSQLN
jgi:hypothetical protein